MGQEPQRFEATDGVGIAYRTWGAAGQGPTVVLHHGYSASAVMNWELPGVVAALTQAGRRVVALDARGHGDSDAPHDPALYGEDRMARDLVELFDRLGLGEVDLVGYSMGSVASLIVATRESRIRRLIVGGIGESVVELGGVDTRIFSPDELAKLLRSGHSGEGIDPGIAAFLMLAAATKADREALAVQALAFHRDPVDLDRIAAPTLVIAGDADPLAANPERLASAIPGGKLRVLAGDHFTTVGHPEFAAEIVTFLGES